MFNGGGKRNHSYIWRGKNTNASVVSQCGIRHPLVVYFALIVEFNSTRVSGVEPINDLSVLPIQ